MYQSVINYKGELYGGEPSYKQFEKPVTNHQINTVYSQPSREDSFGMRSIYYQPSKFPEHIYHTGSHNVMEVHQNNPSSPINQNSSFEIIDETARPSHQKKPQSSLLIPISEFTWISLAITTILLSMVLYMTCKTSFDMAVELVNGSKQPGWKMSGLWTLGLGLILIIVIYLSNVKIITNEK